MHTPYATRSPIKALSVFVLFFASVVISGLPMNALALTCGSRQFTLSEAYEAADSIVVGLVTECEEEVSSEPWANGGSGCSFDSLEVLKESKPARDHRGLMSSSGCGLSLKVGTQYLLFLDAENKPMRFSADLNGMANEAQSSNTYVELLRDYRDGATTDLSEPWTFSEQGASCHLSHSVSGHVIRFILQKPDAEIQSWKGESVDGKTIFKGQTIPANPNIPPREAKLVITGKVPGFPASGKMLAITVPERPPAPKRSATISVGTSHWPLYRTEQELFLGDRSLITRIEYVVAGPVPEQILSALSKPSNIVISAALIDSRDDGPTSEPTALYQQPVLRGAGETVLEPSITAVPRGAGVVHYASRPAAQLEPVLRLETRNTQLPAALADFQACYE